MTVVSLFFQWIGNSLFLFFIYLFSARTSTTNMEASMYMHISCSRAMSAQVDTNFRSNLFACSECSQVSSVRKKDIRIGKQ